MNTPNRPAVRPGSRLRALVPGVPLAPVAGDDLAYRLGLRHYPALITATGCGTSWAPFHVRRTATSQQEARNYSAPAGASQS